MSAQVRLGYKSTEVGVIPADWAVEPLTNVSDKIMVGIASSATHAYRREGIPLLRNQNIKAGYLDDADVLYVDPEYESTFKNKRLEAGDLLIARTGYPGTTCVVPSKYESAQSFTTLIVRPDKSKVDSNYLCYYLNSEYGQNFFEQSQIGGAQKNVNAGSLKAMPVPVQLLPEQRAIAAALSDMDALISGLDQLIAKKRDIKQAAMQQLLSGQQNLPGFSGEWEVKRLGDVAELKQGYTFQSSTYTSVGEFNIVTIANVQNGYMDISGCNKIEFLPRDIQPHQKLKINDILISMTGNVGRVCRVEESGCLLNQRVGKLSTTSIDDKFFFYQVSMPRFIVSMMGKAKGGAQANLSTPDITEYLIQVPTSKEEQIAIATILSDMDSELITLERRRDKARQLKQGMMQELLTGRIRLSQSSQEATLC